MTKTLSSNIRLKTLTPTAQIPSYATDNAAGMDLVADGIRDIDFTVIHPGERALIKTGIAIALPEYLEAQVRPRSGLALKHGVTVLNAPGTIDADYRGEIGVILINHGSEPYTVYPGDRIAQLVVAQVVSGAFEVVDDLDQTTRGTGGFGSTGTTA